MVVCDIEGSTTRTNPAKAALRADMYDLLEAALLDCKITEDLREPSTNTGDGVLTLVRPSTWCRRRCCCTPSSPR